MQKPQLQFGILALALAAASFTGARAEEDDGSAARAKRMKVMSYNVQNLFDTVDSEDTNDSEFTPDGKQKWTETVIRDKIANLGHVIKAQSPDVIALSEVESQEMVDRLVKEGLA